MKMNRAKNIAVIQLSGSYGSPSYAFEDTQTALEFMAMLSKSVQVDHEGYSMREDTTCTYFVANSESMPEMKFVPAHKFNTEETVEEAKARFKREKEDRADMDQKFKEAPPALEPPSVTIVDDNIPF